MDKKVFIIAEAGVNHNGSIELARDMVDAAVAAGADAIKFQSFKAETLACRSLEKAGYQKAAGDAGQSQFEMLKKLELSDEDHKFLKDYCDKKGIEFLSTPFGISELEMLVQMGIKKIKIPSGEMTNVPFLRKAAKLGLPIIMSTGMATMEEVGYALEVLTTSGVAKENITVLQCTTAYPTPYDDVNLRAMITMRDTFGLETGYSDHTVGIEVAIAATALGARVIEKHFTLSRDLEGPDHKASVEPGELKAMVTAIRNVEKALGNGVKHPSKSEKDIAKVVRKRILASVDIKQGDMFTENNITTKRSSDGLDVAVWDTVLGKTAVRHIMADEPVGEGDLLAEVERRRVER